MIADECENLFFPQIGSEDVTDGSVENYDLDWPSPLPEGDTLPLSGKGESAK